MVASDHAVVDILFTLFHFLIMKNQQNCNHHYIKVIYQGTVYGPFQGPITMEKLARMIRVSIRADPILTSMDSETIIVVSDPYEELFAGLFSLAANPNIMYDEKLDGEVIKPIPNRFGLFKNIQTQTDSTLNEYHHENSGICNLPLDRSEMDAICESMIHLISSIPPRYIKYNKVLSQQIGISLNQVNQWIKHLSVLYVEFVSDKTGLHASGASFETYITFIQYRILNLLHDIWKKVWTRFPPSNRVFNVSTIYTYNSLEKAEHILNCLSSWRRMIDVESWDKIHRHNNHLVQQDVKKQPDTAKSRLLQPSRLPSAEHASDSIALVQKCNGLEDIINKKELETFRIAFLQEVKHRTVFKNDDLKDIKTQMLKEKKFNRVSIDFISKAIEKEFRIY